MPTLSLIGSAAGGLQELRPHLMEPLKDRGWSTVVTVTPSAYSWLETAGELPKIEELSGYPVYGAPRLPTETTVPPKPDCYAVVPASSNTIAHLALGIADNQALTTACAAIGARNTPVIVFPVMNRAYAGHPAWDGHIATLRDAGVHMLYGDDVWPLPEPNGDPGWYLPTGRVLPWDAILVAISDTV
ncbi:flavoprotein [Streptomyces sp. NPDC016566]|uniref:flavoprotein n=1 Tax=Streptomyces sp. NPDC016566 TaxID=3364967 RepID=UPI0036FF73D0